MKKHPKVTVYNRVQLKTIFSLLAEISNISQTMAKDYVSTECNDIRLLDYSNELRTIKNKYIERMVDGYYLTNDLEVANCNAVTYFPVTPGLLRFEFEGIKITYDIPTSESAMFMTVYHENGDKNVNILITKNMPCDVVVYNSLNQRMNSLHETDVIVVEDNDLISEMELLVHDVFNVHMADKYLTKFKNIYNETVLSMLVGKPTYEELLEQRGIMPFK